MKLKPVRIGLWDQYGGSMPSGWTRWIFEQYEFPFEVVYPQTLDAGNLNAKFDVLVFVDGGIPERDPAVAGQAAAAVGAQPAAERIPAEFRGWLGRVTVAKTVPELKKFVENGGTVLTIGSSTALGYHLGLPIRDALVERSTGDGASAAAREVLHPGHDSRGADRQHAPARVRHGRTGDGVLRREPGVPAAAGGAAQGREAGRLVRQPDAAAQRLGVGPAVSRSGGVDCRGAGRQEAASCCSAPKCCGARSRTARSRCSSTASTMGAPRRRAAAGARTDGR